MIAVRPILCDPHLSFRIEDIGHELNRRQPTIGKEFPHHIVARNAGKPNLSDKSFFLELLYGLKHPTGPNDLLQGQSQRRDQLPGFNLVVQLEYVDLFAP